MSHLHTESAFVNPDDKGDGDFIELTVLTKASGSLSKTISLDASGKVKSNGSACKMQRGLAERLPLKNLSDFGLVLQTLSSSQAIALGQLRPDLPKRVSVATKKDLRNAPAGTVARTADFIQYAPGKQALVLIDYDAKALPERLTRINPYESLLSVCPALEHAGTVGRRSTSSGLYRTDTGEELNGSGGAHLYILVRDGSDAERFLRALHGRLWLAGFGWGDLGSSGQFLQRSLIDRSVYAAERLCFEGQPILAHPLGQKPREAVVQDGGALDTRQACPDLSPAEEAEFKRLVDLEKMRLKPEAERLLAVHTARQVKELVERKGCSEAVARRIVEAQHNGVLLPWIVLPWDDDELAGCTVEDVLKNPDRFVGETLADPLEGIDYGSGKAKVLRREDGSLWIHSFAHGRTIYELNWDAASIETAMKAGDPKDAAATLVRLILFAALGADEEQALKELACQLSGAKIRPLTARIKAERQKQEDQRKEERRTAARRAEQRVILDAPCASAEITPVITVIEEVFLNVSDPEPPMRNLSGKLAMIEVREPYSLHALTSADANGEDNGETRLPPPRLPLLTEHDTTSTAFLLENYICFMSRDNEGNEFPVSLLGNFVKHLLNHRHSRLPVVAGIVTNPLIMPNGTLLTGVGLNRQYKLVFRIDPALSKALPSQENTTRDQVRESFRFLCDEWLCDVSTDISGKCVLISAALSMLQRLMFPERPGFIVSAGKRGSGKTTAVAMAVAAGTGYRPAATAWSADAEERRKAILAALLEGPAAIVWDNIPRGGTIRCPILEQVLTTETYSDRILGESRKPIVSATTIQLFTGNNITAGGDMLSRTLECRLETDRPDPENRAFKHSDPIGWTLAHRTELLRCLYTVMLGNPQLLKPLGESKTRFKDWYHLVGSAIEHAAGLCGHEVDFRKRLIESEEGGEETANMVSVLELIQRWKPNDGRFTASDMARIINHPGEGEYEMANAFREQFAPTGGRRPGTIVMVSSKTVGTSLKAQTEMPVRSGNTILILRSARDSYSNGNVYWVQAKPC